MKILIVDDEPIFRRGLITYLPEEAQIAEAGDCGSACEALTEQQFDYIILDLGLPDTTGLDALNRIREIESNTPVIIISGRESRDFVVTATKNNAAQAFIPKSTKEFSILIPILSLVKEGGKYLPDLVFGDSYERVLNLTDREMAVLMRLMEGEQNKIIADKLGITENTVKEHVSRILSKMNAKNRTDAARIARDEYGIYSAG